MLPGAGTAASIGIDASLIAKDVAFTKSKGNIKQEFARGGMVKGQRGQAVNIKAHAGEMVLSPTQTKALAKAYGGTNKKDPPGMWSRIKRFMSQDDGTSARSFAADKTSQLGYTKKLHTRPDYKVEERDLITTTLRKPKTAYTSADFAQVKANQERASHVMQKLRAQFNQSGSTKSGTLVRSKGELQAIKARTGSQDIQSQASMVAGRADITYNEKLKIIQKAKSEKLKAASKLPVYQRNRAIKEAIKEAKNQIIAAKKFEAGSVSKYRQVGEKNRVFGATGYEGARNKASNEKIFAADAVRRKRIGATPPPKMTKFDVTTSSAKMPKIPNMTEVAGIKVVEGIGGPMVYPAGGRKMSKAGLSTASGMVRSWWNEIERKGKEGHLTPEYVIQSKKQYENQYGIGIILPKKKIESMLSPVSRETRLAAMMTDTKTRRAGSRLIDTKVTKEEMAKLGESVNVSGAMIAKTSAQGSTIIANTVNNSSSNTSSSNTSNSSNVSNGGGSGGSGYSSLENGDTIAGIISGRMT
jgi:hypothetical protein